MCDIDSPVFNFHYAFFERRGYSLGNTHGLIFKLRKKIMIGERVPDWQLLGEGSLFIP